MGCLRRGEQAPLDLLEPRVFLFLGDLARHRGVQGRVWHSRMRSSRPCVQMPIFRAVTHWTIRLPQASSQYLPHRQRGERVANAYGFACA